jgi:hypothetical protein
LKHSLEEHRNDAVRNRCIPWQCPGVGGEEALKMLVAATPPSFQVVQRARFEVCGLLTDLNGSILTISVQPSPLGSSAFVQLLLYALSDAQAASVENHWRTLLARLFPFQP